MSKIVRRGRKRLKKRGRPRKVGQTSLRGIKVRGLETTGRAVTTALRSYKRHGATVAQIHRALTKRDKARKIRQTRTLASVKLAVARAVNRGSVRPPKDWHGFRGLGVKPRTGREGGRRPSKPKRRSSTRKKSTTRRKSVRRGSTASRRASVRRGSNAVRRRAMRGRPPRSRDKNAHASRSSSTQAQDDDDEEMVPIWRAYMCNIS